MKYKSTEAQLLTVPPNMTGFITVIITAYFSDKVRVRGPFIAGGCIIGICGYIMLLVSESNPVKYGGTFLIAVGVFQASPMLMVRFHLPLLPPVSWKETIESSLPSDNDTNSSPIFFRRVGRETILLRIM
jgi:hypothetical protein